MVPGQFPCSWLGWVRRFQKHCSWSQATYNSYSLRTPSDIPHKGKAFSSFKEFKEQQNRLQKRTLKYLGNSHLHHHSHCTVQTSCLIPSHLRQKLTETKSIVCAQKYFWRFWTRLVLNLPVEISKRSRCRSNKFFLSIPLSWRRQTLHQSLPSSLSFWIDSFWRISILAFGFQHARYESHPRNCIWNKQCLSVHDSSWKTGLPLLASSPCFGVRESNSYFRSTIQWTLILSAQPWVFLESSSAWTWKIDLYIQKIGKTCVEPIQDFLVTRHMKIHSVTMLYVLLQSYMH